MFLLQSGLGHKIIFETLVIGCCTHRRHSHSETGAHELPSFVIISKTLEIYLEDKLISRQRGSIFRVFSLNLRCGGGM